MITKKVNSVNSYSQEQYNQFINNLNLCTLTCPKKHCHHHDFVKHGYYVRTLKLNDCTVRLRILRVRCKHCGSTHAVLLSFMVPYSQLSLETQLAIIVSDHINDFNDIMNTNNDLNEFTFYYIRKQYKKYWKQRLYSFAISLKDHLIEMCFQWFSQQFMQIHCMYNILI